jgi:hypothetical protein
VCFWKNLKSSVPWKKHITIVPEKLGAWKWQDRGPTDKNVRFPFKVKKLAAPKKRKSLRL